MTPPAPDRVLPALLLALTVVTGFVDAVSYLALGHVFTANMTGNVVFLAFAIATAPGLSIGRSGAALGAFVIGAIIGGRLAARMGNGPRHRWMSAGFGIEAALLVAAAALAAGAGDDLLRDPERLYGVIALTGLAMGHHGDRGRLLARGGRQSGMDEARRLGRGDVRGGGGWRVASPVLGSAAGGDIRCHLGSLCRGRPGRRIERRGRLPVNRIKLRGFR